MVPSLAAACTFAVLIGLGTWQVKRLAWKEALIATVTARLAAAPAPLPPPAEWAPLDAATDEYRRVAFRAELVNDKEALVFTTGSSMRAYLVHSPTLLPKFFVHNCLTCHYNVETYDNRILTLDLQRPYFSCDRSYTINLFSISL